LGIGIIGTRFTRTQFLLILLNSLTLTLSQREREYQVGERISSGREVIRRERGIQGDTGFQRNEAGSCVITE